MRIHLDRKKLLCLSFFLCCVLPPCFNWFSLEPEADAWTGLSLMPVPLLVGMTLYAFALLFDRFRHVLSLGVLAHGLPDQFGYDAHLDLQGFFFRIQLCCVGQLLKDRLHIVRDEIPLRQ